ncbi:MAG: hypothetical protein RIS70_1607 [Planctomycetota bacterium]
MAWVVFHTRRVRETLSKPPALWADALLLLLVAAAVGGVVLLAAEAAAPQQSRLVIDLRFSALPKYAILSLARGFAAYALSLLFTLVYATTAAHHARAERIMIPALDVLQSVPVLAFLPGLVLAMIRLFPSREVGLEIACIVMIFTGQVWNMTFSFHGSLRAIPTTLREVAAVNHLRGFQAFGWLEIPAAMIGLVWNSMMSMAGGWFFLTVTEAFTLGNQDYRLPGIGSYMSDAMQQGNASAIAGGLITMLVIIVVVDQFFWRPIVAWSQRFKMEEIAAAESPHSWVLSTIQHSHLHLWLGNLWAHFHATRFAISAHESRSVERPGLLLSRIERWRLTRVAGAWGVIRPVVGGAIVAAIAAGVVWGLWSLVMLLRDLPLDDPTTHDDWRHIVMALGASFLRTSAAVVLGAIWTLPVGIMIGRSPKWSRRMQPIIQVLASFPAPMLFPLAIAALNWFHVPFTIGCVSLMLLGTQWYILFNIIAGATAIPADLKEVATVYRLGAVNRWTKLYIPCVFPYLITGLVTAAGGAWNATIVSEYLHLHGTTYSAFGLGSTINHATASGNFSLLAASVVVMAVSVVSINRLFWKRLYRLAEVRYSLTS